MRSKVVAALRLIGVISVAMLTSIITLSKLTGIQMASPDVEFVTADGVTPATGYVQDTVIAQLAKTVFDGFPIGIGVVTIVTGIILILAANTAFNGFPVLGSILAKDGFLPRQLHTRGDRLAYSNGILILAAAAAALIVAYKAEVNSLIQLYIVGVFVSFTLSQTGMIRHWNRALKAETDPKLRSHMVRSRVINAIGAVMSGTVLVVVLITKFMEGARYAILAMAVLFAMMLAIRRHYTKVSTELAVDDDYRQLLPSRVHAVVLVSKIHKPAMRALAYARASRATTLEALTVSVDQEDS